MLEEAVSLGAESCKRGVACLSRANVEHNPRLQSLQAHLRERFADYSMAARARPGLKGDKGSILAYTKETTFVVKPPWYCDPYLPSVRRAFLEPLLHESAPLKRQPKSVRGVSLDPPRGTFLSRPIEASHSK